MKKLFMLIVTTMLLGLLLITASAEPVQGPCPPDVHEFIQVDDSYTCKYCSTTATFVSKGTNNLVTAMNAATSGDILLLEAGEHTITQCLPILGSAEYGKNKLTIIGYGEEKADTVIKAPQEYGNNHMFNVKSDNVNAPAELTLVNLTLDRAHGTPENADKTGTAGVCVRNASTANLYHVDIKTRNDNTSGWFGIQINNNNNGDVGESAIYAYDVDLYKYDAGNPKVVTPDGTTKIGATTTTYAKLVYDSACNITDITTEGSGKDTGHTIVTPIDPVPDGCGVASVTHPDGRVQEYGSFAGAIGVVSDPLAPAGDYTITLLKDCDERVTIQQQDGVNVTVTAANKETIAYSGTIYIDGMKRRGPDVAETVTIKDMKFDGSEKTAGHDAINFYDSIRYTHNITITGCVFVDDDHWLTAIRGRGFDDVFVYKCTQQGGFQFLWADSGTNGTNTIDSVQVSGVTEGTNIGNSCFTIINSNINASDFGLRFNVASGSGLSDSLAHYVTGCTLTAPKPIVIRPNGPGNVILDGTTTLTIASGGTTAIEDMTGGAAVVDLANANITVKANTGLNAITSVPEKRVAYAGGTYMVVADGTYIVNAGAGSGGSISPSGNVAVTSGQTQTFTITPQAGYRISSVLVDGSSVDSVEYYTFENVTGDHNITASFALVPVTPVIPDNSGDSGDISYPVTAPEATNGSVELTAKRAESGDTVKVDVHPDPGYGVSKVTVVTRSGKEIEVALKDGEYTFEMPAGGVEVKAEFVKTGSGFADVPNQHWAYDEVAWADANGYMNGKTATAFDPGNTASRQQLWMILARHAKYDPANMAAAKAWAVANGISDGSNPGTAVTRQQLVTLLYRYAVMMDYDVDSSAELTLFPDAAAVSGYAQDAMAWAVANGIVGGTTQGTLNPAGTANRAQFAVMLYRFCEKMN